MDSKPNKPTGVAASVVQTVYVTEVWRKMLGDSPSVDDPIIEDPRKPKPVLNDNEAAEKMAACGKADSEIGHGMADDLLCEILMSLGYTKTVEEFHKLHKWYA